MTTSVAGNLEDHNTFFFFFPFLLQNVLGLLCQRPGIPKSLNEKFTADPFINGLWVSVESKRLNHVTEGKTMGAKVCRIHAKILKST